MSSIRGRLNNVSIQSIPENLCYVVSFDPGETTGWFVLGVHPSALDGSGFHGVGLNNAVAYMDWGQIECGAPEGWVTSANKHAGLNIGGENAGISDMIALTEQFPHCAVVVEDFIPDMTKMDKARHTLSPVRLLAGFSYGMSCIADQCGETVRLGDERIFVQNRSLAKTTCTDDRLKEWGFWDKSIGAHKNRHARDALRHAYYFLRDCEGKAAKNAENRWLAWPHLFDDPQLDVRGYSLRDKPTRTRPKGERI